VRADETREERGVVAGPAPISSTRWPGSRRSASSISAIIVGCDDELVAAPRSFVFVTIASSR
jgi:hypothetical protein